MDFSLLTNDEVRDQIEAMELALKVALENPFEGAKPSLLQKLKAAKAEMEKRDAHRP